MESRRRLPFPMILGAIGLSIFYLALHWQLWLPITYQEAQESYTTLAWLKTGSDIFGQHGLSIMLHFTSSPVAVLLRSPFIMVGGLNDVTVRLPTAT